MKPTTTHNPHFRNQLIRACATWGLHPQQLRRELRLESSLSHRQWQQLQRGEPPGRNRAALRQLLERRPQPWPAHEWLWPKLCEQLWEEPELGLVVPERYLLEALALRGLTVWQVELLIHRRGYGRLPQGRLALWAKGESLGPALVTAGPVLGHLLRIPLEPLMTQL